MKYLFYTLFIALLASCNFTGFQNLKEVDLNQLDKLVEMSKGPCYGRCPVYTLTVYENGVMTYEGLRFTDREGVYIKKMADVDLKAMKTMLRDANLQQFRDAYRATLADLQSVSISYYGNNTIKTIVGKDGRPEAVMNIQGELEKLADAEGWELKTRTKEGLPDYIVENELRVTLYDGVDARAWARKYRKQGMQVVEIMSERNNSWLMEFNATKNDPEEVLAIVQADLEVSNAEFNRKSTN
ncbi:MAG: DUF6438 domain-containing protein [Bacteroidota bacterium]